jgi:DNA-binding transcriptional ArsR family regulator
MNSRRAAPADRTARRTLPRRRKRRPHRLSDDTLERLAGLFDVLADGTRLRALLALAAGEEMHVTALCAAIGRPTRAALCYHLEALRLAGLVICRWEGRRHFYRLECAPLRMLLERLLAEAGDDRGCVRFAGLALAYKRGRRARRGLG